MTYIEKNLLPQEKLIYRARLHRVMYLPCAVFLVIAVVALIASGSRVSGAREALVGVGALFFFLSIATFVNRWIREKTSEFGVTNRRVLIKAGLIRRTSLELLLRQIEGIGVEQGVLGRMLGFGTIVVAGTGGTKERFDQISDPMEFRKQVQGQSINDIAPAPSAAPVAAEEKTCPSCAEQVKRAARVCRYCGHRFD